MTAGWSKKGYDFEPLSWEVLGACIEVQRQLGRHCMEVDFQRALAIELRKRGIQFQREFEIPIVYDGIHVTRRRVDFLIWDDNASFCWKPKPEKPSSMRTSSSVCFTSKTGTIKSACW